MTYLSNLERLVAAGLYEPKPSTLMCDLKIADDTPYELLEMACKDFKERGIKPLSISWVLSNMIDLESYKTVMALRKEAELVEQRNEKKRKGKTQFRKEYSEAMFG